jgi:hypothetical protein
VVFIRLVLPRPVIKYSVISYNTDLYAFP